MAQISVPKSSQEKRGAREGTHTKIWFFEPARFSRPSKVIVDVDATSLPIQYIICAKIVEIPSYAGLRYQGMLSTRQPTDEDGVTPALSLSMGFVVLLRGSSAMGVGSVGPATRLSPLVVCCDRRLLPCHTCPSAFRVRDVKCQARTAALPVAAAALCGPRNTCIGFFVFNHRQVVRSIYDWPDLTIISQAEFA